MFSADPALHPCIHRRRADRSRGGSPPCTTAASSPSWTWWTPWWLRKRHSGPRMRRGRIRQLYCVLRRHDSDSDQILIVETENTFPNGSWEEVREPVTISATAAAAAGSTTSFAARTLRWKVRACRYPRSLVPRLLNQLDRGHFSPIDVRVWLSLPRCGMTWWRAVRSHRCLSGFNLTILSPVITFPFHPC